VLPIIGVQLRLLCWILAVRFVCVRACVCVCVHVCACLLGVGVFDVGPFAHVGSLEALNVD
jgi:hypothetical protein